MTRSPMEISVLPNIAFLYATLLRYMGEGMESEELWTAQEDILGLEEEYLNASKVRAKKIEILCMC